MADSYELRQGDKVLNVIDDDLAVEVEAAVAQERLQEDLEALERPERDRRDDTLGCDC